MCEHDAHDTLYIASEQYPHSAAQQQIDTFVKFNPKAVVSIKFADYHGSSEGAVDMGGPRREYFRLLIRAVNLESGIFCGPEDNRIIFPNATGAYNTLFTHYSFILSNEDFNP